MKTNNSPLPGVHNDTIAAIATAYGHGAIGIVRMSGAGVLDVLSKVFEPAQQRRKNARPACEANESVWGRVSLKSSHRMYYGNIMNAGEVVDEVMVCPMLAPRSYTREDTVEIYAHGGMVVLRSVLDAVLQAGARLAEPGEFTKRAFLNGRINLTQAEAVMDLINAGSDAARRASLRQLGGGLSCRVEGLRDRILTWIAHIELSIDYPEHEEEAATMAQILAEGSEVLVGLESLYKTAAVGRMLRDGIRTAIIGRPNAGKSTLLNAILSEDRAIVHEKAGTTRDVLTERVVIGEIPLLLMDTAGLRETDDEVEKIGVEKTIAVAMEAELVLYVVDGTVGLADEDREMLARVGGKPVLVLYNKSDLYLPCSDVQDCALHISTLTGEGMDTLYDTIQQVIFSSMGQVTHHTENTDIITRERHRILIEQAMSHVHIAMSEIAQGVPEDLVSVNLRAAYMALGEVLGVEVADDILDRIFSEFCLGK